VQQMASDDSPVPTIEAVQNDVGFANSFRIELIKLILTLAPAMLAFTIAFRPKIKDPDFIVLMWIGWPALGLATVGAMINMYGWERFYASYRDHKESIETGKKVREKITRRRRFGAMLQFSGFGVGVLAIACFAAVNIDKVQSVP